MSGASGSRRECLDRLWPGSYGAARQLAVHRTCLHRRQSRSGVSASALRFYERQGLIRARRTSGNQRRYGREILRQVAFIRASHHLGIPLTVIGDVLALLPEGTVPSREFWVRASACWSAALNARIEQLERMRDLFTECIGCGCLSFDQCGLVNPDDELGEHGAGPRRLLEA